MNRTPLGCSGEGSTAQRIFARGCSVGSLLLLLMILPAAAAALSLDGGSSYSLSGHLEQLVPQGPADDIAAVAGGRAGRFVKLPGQLIDGTGPPRAFWLRFTVTAGEGAPDKLFLRVMPPFLDRVELYQPNGDGWSRLMAGDALPHSQWPVTDRSSSFPIDVAPGSRTYYVRVTQNGLLNAYFMLYTPDGFHQLQIYETLSFGLYFGVLFSLTLINLLHWATLREPIFGELSLFLILRASFFLGFNGLIFLYIIPQQPQLSDYLLKTLLAATVASQILLILRLLELPALYPRLSRLFYGFALFAGAVGMSLWFGLFTRLMGLLILIHLITGVIGVFVAMDHVRLKRPLGRMLLFVMAVLLLLQMIIALPSLGFERGMMMDLYGGQIGSLIIMLTIHVAVAMRVVELKKARNASEQAARLAASDAANERAARQEQADFVSMLFHEIKTPLAEIDSAATVLEHLDEGTVRGTGDRYDTIHGAVERLNRLVEKSLARDRQGLDMTYLNRTDIVLRQVAETVLSGFRGHHGERLTLSGGEKLAPLQADPEMLRVALANLIDNAIKYSPPETEIHIRLGKDGRLQTLSVSDAGPGMDETTTGRVFDRYWRGQSTEGTTGAGLGLYLVRKIIHAHGGEVLIESRPGNGSRFILALPESAT